MKALLAVLILCGSVWAQPIDGPYELLSYGNSSPFFEPFFCIQNDSIGQLFYTREIGNQYQQVSRLYSLSSHEYLTEERVHSYSWNSGYLVTVQIKGERWAFTTGEYMVERFVAGADSIEVDHGAWGYCCDGCLQPDYFMNDFWPDSDESWTVAAVGTWPGIDGYPPIFCGDIVRHSPTGSDTLFHQSDSLLDIGQQDLLFCPLDSDSFAVIIAIEAQVEPLISLIGPHTNIFDVTHSIADDHPIGNVLDAEWIGGTRFRIIAEGWGGLRFIMRDLTNEHQVSAVIDSLSDFEITDLCRVPGYGWAAVEATELEVRLVRIDTLGVATSAPGTVYWRDPGYRVIYAKLTADSTGNTYVYWRELISGNPPQQRVQYAAVSWNTELPVLDESDLFPTSFSLSAYPNPFNSSVQIEYEIAKAGEIELAVFNTLGQKVETLFEGNASLGKHEVTWSPSGTSGVYFVKLAGGDVQESRKILYLR